MWVFEWRSRDLPLVFLPFLRSTFLLCSFTLGWFESTNGPHNTATSG